MTNKPSGADKGTKDPYDFHLDQKNSFLGIT